MSVTAYKKQSLLKGWTRVDLLLQIYDRAITSIEACGFANDNDDLPAYSRHFIDAQKAILAIHSGLKPDEDEVAFNVARLLHFAAIAIEKKEFEDAIKILRELRDGFAATDRFQRDLFLVFADNGQKNPSIFHGFQGLLEICISFAEVMMASQYQILPPDIADNASP